MRVFIADDSSLLRRHLVELLHEIDEIEIIGQAQGAQEALDGIRTLKPDVITLDIQLLEGSGIDVLTKIRKEEFSPIVIMLTNHVSLPYRQKCMQAGADFFFDKAIEIYEVKRIIQDLLSRFKRTAG